MRGMKNILRWNYEKQAYKLYVIPSTWSVKKAVSSMYLNANCAQCGRLIKYGGMYESRELYTDSGEGYAVCKECHAKEVARENKIRGLDNRNETT